MFGLWPSTTALLLCGTGSLLAGRAAADAPLFDNLEAYQAGALGRQPNQTFFSSPLAAPRLQVNHFNPARVDPTCPYLFLTGGHGLGHGHHGDGGDHTGYGPSIVSARDLSLVWADPAYASAQAHRVYDDWRWAGDRVLAVFAGEVVRVYDERYEQIFEVRPQGRLLGAPPDSHEAYLTPDGHVAMIVLGVEPAPKRNRTAAGDGGGDEGEGEDGDGDGDEVIINCYAQEVDPVTNEVLFEFSLKDHFTAEDSYWPRDRGSDIFHMNSIEKTPDGDFLISVRHLHAILLVDGRTGDLKWTLGGRRSDFRAVTRDGRSPHFAWQHDARFTDYPRRLTLFDNHGLTTGFCTSSSSPSSSCARALELELDLDARTYAVADEWRHPQGLASGSRGGVQRTPGGHTLVAWGQNPAYTEHAPDSGGGEGELVMDFQRGQVLELEHGVGELVAYRAWKGDWVGRPRWPPSIASHRLGGVTTVYVSWNGATEVAGWLLSDHAYGLDGAEAVAWTSPRLGFETPFPLLLLDDDSDGDIDSDSYSFSGSSSSAASSSDSRGPKQRRYARAVALDADGAPLGHTAAVDTRTHAVFEPGYPVGSLAEPAAQRTREMARRGDAPAVAFAAVWLAVGFTVSSIALSLRRRPRAEDHVLLPVAEDDKEQEHGVGAAGAVDGTAPQ
ncbi:ASST-domain-containing protein [Xylariaceae sp. FL0804]|nr:ASST-domain-containing protein [Xylariaceae sp. FL0804]